MYRHCFGQYLDIIWNIFGQYLDNILWQDLDDIWTLFQIYLYNILTLYKHHFGQYFDNIWTIFRHVKTCNPCNPGPQIFLTIAEISSTNMTKKVILQQKQDIFCANFQGINLTFICFKCLIFLGRAVAQAPISGFVILPACLSACLSVTVSFWRGFESSHWV